MSSKNSKKIRRLTEEILNEFDKTQIKEMIREATVAGEYDKGVREVCINHVGELFPPQAYAAARILSKLQLKKDTKKTRSS